MKRKADRPERNAGSARTKNPSRGSDDRIFENEPPVYAGLSASIVCLRYPGLTAWAMNGPIQAI